MLTFYENHIIIAKTYSREPSNTWQPLHFFNQCKTTSLAFDIYFLNDLVIASVPCALCWRRKAFRKKTCGPRRRHKLPKHWILSFGRHIIDRRGTDNDANIRQKNDRQSDQHGNALNLDSEKMMPRAAVEVETEKDKQTDKGGYYKLTKTYYQKNPACPRQP
jgi:hypothetical protein